MQFPITALVAPFRKLCLRFGFARRVSRDNTRLTFHWVHLQDPLIEIDNNLVENAIRPTALGKKNCLFFGDANAGERGAVIYSIIESFRRHGVEPYSYLRDVLTRLPSMTNRQIKDIVPKAWAAAEKAATRKAV